MACNIDSMDEQRVSIGKGDDVEEAPWTAGAIWAVVPVKRLAAAKRRLSAALGGAREEFAYLLACRTLDVLQSTGVFAGTLVVTPDPRVAAAARARGALVVDDADGSLNDACALGLDAAARHGASLAVLLPSDLATLTAEALSGLVRAHARVQGRAERGDRSRALQGGNGHQPGDARAASVVSAVVRSRQLFEASARGGCGCA